MGNTDVWDIDYYAPFTTAPDSINSYFHLINFHDPRLTEIYDYAIGDVYEREDYHYEATGYTLEETLDSIRVKTSSLTGVDYDDTLHSATITYDGTTLVGSSYYHMSTTIGADTNFLIDPFAMPEENNIGGLYHYYPNNAPSTLPSCYGGDTYELDQYSGYGGDMGMGLNFYSETYQPGYGKTSIYSVNYSYNITEQMLLIYAYKNGDPCFGSFDKTALAVTTITPIQNDIRIFPNPASNELTIKPSLIQDYTITIYNLIGQVMQTMSTNKQQTINVSSYPSGIYSVSVNDDLGNRKNEKITIVH